MCVYVSKFGAATVLAQEPVMNRFDYLMMTRRSWDLG